MKPFCLYILCFFFSISLHAVQVNRVLSQSSVPSSGELLVTLNISKAGVSGIAKLKEEIPSGFRTKVVSSGGGKVLMNRNGELKIIWLTLPTKDRFSVSYKLIHQGKNTGDFYLKGTFTYVVKDATEKQEYSIKGSLLSVVPEQQTKSYTKKKKDGPLEAEELATNNGGFAVQLGVYSSEKSKSIFGDLPEVHFKKTPSRLFKYYSGKSLTKKQAEKVLEKAKAKGFSTAFIVKV